MCIRTIDSLFTHQCAPRQLEAAFPLWRWSRCMIASWSDCRATILIGHMSAPQMICALTGRDAYAWRKRIHRVERVQSIALMALTLGNPPLAANCALMSASSAALSGNLVYLLDMWMTPSRAAGLVELRVDWHSADQVCQLPLGSSLMQHPLFAAPIRAAAWHRVLTEPPWRTWNQPLTFTRASWWSIAVFALSSNSAGAATVTIIIISTLLCACFYTRHCNWYYFGNHSPTSPVSAANRPTSAEHIHASQWHFHSQVKFCAYILFVCDPVDFSFLFFLHCFFLLSCIMCIDRKHWNP